MLLFLFLKSPRRALRPSAIIFVCFIGGVSLLYGGGIWLAFWQGLGAAAAHVAAGTINQQWISSVYGALLAYGAANEVAVFMHAMVLLGVVGLTLYVFRDTPSQRFWAASGMATVFASPYLMYYDLVFFLFPMALVLDVIDMRAARIWVYLLFVVELVLLVLLGFETASGLGVVAFLGLAMMLLIGKAKFGGFQGASQS